MRKWVVPVLVALVLMGGIGVAVAQLDEGGSDDEVEIPTDTAPVSPPALATTPDTSTSSPDLSSSTTTLPPSLGTTAVRTSPVPPTTTTKIDLSKLPFTLPTWSPFPPPASSPTFPLYPNDPAPTFPEPQSKVVQPRPGMENLHKTPWDRAEVTGAEPGPDPLRQRR